MAEIDLEALALSDRAKAVCGAWFGMMLPGKGDVTFQLREGRPSAEAQDGLDELVRAGVISVEAFNQYGGLVYRPLIDCRWAHKWLGKNLKNPAAKIRMIVPLANEKEGKQYQSAALRARLMEGEGEK